MKFLIFLSVVLQFETILSKLIKLDSNRFIVINHFNHLNSNWTNNIKIKEDDLNSSILKQNYQIKSQDFNFNKAFQSYQIIYTNSDFIWLIATDHSKNYIFFSDDNGISFVAYDGIDSIDNIYVNEFNSDIVVFSDKQNNQVFLSINSGKSLLSKKLNIRPDFISFCGDEAILITEINSNSFKSWLSFDFGNKWELIGENLIQIPQWKKTNQNGYIYWISKDMELKKLEINHLREKKVINKDMVKLEKMQANDLKITKKFTYLTVNDNENKKLLIQKSISDDWIEPLFDLKDDIKKIKKFHIVSDDTNEILVAVNYETIKGEKTDLFVSNDLDHIQFSLSLENITIFEQPDSLRSNVELKSLNKKGEVYIANKYEGDQKKTFTKSPFSNWLPVEFDSQYLKNYSIDLNSYFYFSHENIQFSFEKPKYPEFLMASAARDGSDSFVCLAHLNARNWTPVLKGNYVYTYVNHGHLIVALEKGKAITEMLYSTNYGIEWTKFEFSKIPVYADDLIKHPNEKLNSFILFATDFSTSFKKLFHFDFKNVEISHHHEPNYDDHCPLVCNSLITSHEICVHPEMKCNHFVDCENGIDEQDCDGSKTKPIDVEIEQHVHDLVNFKLKNFHIETNSVYLDLLINIKPNEEIKINKYLVKIVDLTSEQDNSSIFTIRPSELDQMTQFKISNLNYGSEYKGYLLVNITLKERNSFEFVEKDSFKFVVRSETENAASSAEILEKSKFLNKMIIISSIMLLLMFIIFLISKIKSWVKLDFWKNLNKAKVVDQTVIYRKQLNIKDSIVNMKKSKLEARYDLSPFNVDDKACLIDVENC